MRLPDRLARFNRYVTNPVQRLWAGSLPGFGIIEHTGRKSGRAYRTPVNVFRVPDGFAVLLTYGPDRDWVKNLVAAGGGALAHRGRTVPIAGPRVLPVAEAHEFLPPRPSALARRLHVDFVLHVTTPGK
ncbi:nitroreductase family deazaflavin-dependent oxidoreductase [Amycolatopsis nigrescens]|uniref:nitroreductase family deazaflavin-dependent oxidoreductase n=1 Tax=Amycolatopsis nigrescens TaxID=381445 RepID=UPI0003636B56|nr:nitroreductase family deazaflavin-dependent oxidoreductase [Amycolatopsis nigrescens]